MTEQQATSCVIALIVIGGSFTFGLLVGLLL